MNDTPSHNFGDIPLKHAMIAWNPANHGDGRVHVIPHPDDRNWTNFLKLTDTTGACWTVWGKWSKHQRLEKLFIEVWHMVCRDGNDPEVIHKALMVIPEYRETLSGETFFWQQRVKP